MKVLLVSGPPGAGKDEVARVLTDTEIPFLHEKFSMPLRRAVMGFYWFISGRELEQAKRRDHRVRELMIGLSQQVVKPLYGDAYLGVRCARRVLEVMPSRVVITDAGFLTETQAFCDVLRANLEELPEIRLWIVHRPGHDYSNDSREPVAIFGRGTSMVSINNSGTLQQYREEVLSRSREFFK